MLAYDGCWLSCQTVSYRVSYRGLPSFVGKLRARLLMRSRVMLVALKAESG